MASLLAAAGSTNDAAGCYGQWRWPPFVAQKSMAITPTLLSGNWISPQVCCVANFPVTDRSTLLVNQSLQATASNWSTAQCTVGFSLLRFVAQQCRVTCIVFLKLFLGDEPNKCFKSRSTGFSFLASSTKLLSPVATLAVYMGARSRSATFFERPTSFAWMAKPIRSGDSLLMTSLPTM